MLAGTSPRRHQQLGEGSNCSNTIAANFAPSSGLIDLFTAAEQRRRGRVLFPMILDRRMSAFPHLATAALVAAFFAAMLLTADLFTEYRSMKIPAVGIVQVRLPL